MRRLISLVGLWLCFAIPSLSQVPADLPTGDRWISHLTGDLMKFWDMPSALGDPIGAFPTDRCDDGALVDYTRSTCPEFKNNGWLYYDRQRYLVGQSRQTYAYGVAFHVTGNPKYLRYMKAGIDYIRKNAIDREHGGMYLQQDPVTGFWGPKAEWRDPQQLGYGLLSLAFYYYLTHDPEVIDDIVSVKNYIISQYYRSGDNAIGWLLAPDANGNKPSDLKLVSQLDQMNTYLVLLAPILPAPYGDDFSVTAAGIVNIMRTKFYVPEQNLFFLSATTPADLDINKNPPDFGHTSKALWMIRFTGLLRGDADTVAFAEDAARRHLQRAYLADSGSWAGAALPGGANDPNKNWWVYAELDQLAGTLALSDSSQSIYLKQTWNYWFTYFVDPEFGEVWNGVTAGTNQPIKDMPKQWPWKNGYHSMEHALVGYIVAQQMQTLPVTLYYAFTANPDPALVRPYYYTGNLQSLERITDASSAPIYRAQFTDIR